MVIQKAAEEIKMLAAPMGNMNLALFRPKLHGQYSIIFKKRIKYYEQIVKNGIIKKKTCCNV